MDFDKELMVPGKDQAELKLTAFVKGTAVIYDQNLYSKKRDGTFVDQKVEEDIYE